MRVVRPTIFSLLDTPAFGGAEQYLTAHLQFLHAHGYSIFLGTNNVVVARELRKRIGESNNFQVVHAPYRLDAIGNWKGFLKYWICAPWAVVWLVWTLLKLKKKGPVICLLPGWSDRLTFSPFIKMLGLPLLWIEYGPLEPVFLRNWGFPKLLFRTMRGLPDEVITISEWTKESLVNTGGVDSRKISLIYPGVPHFTDQQILNLQKRGKKERKKWGISDETVIGFVGRLASENQVDLLIRAFADLFHSKKIPQSARVFIIGDGPEKSFYESLARELGVDKQITFTGFIDENLKFALLSICDLFVYTHAWPLQGFGITTIEAMSLGLPVITPKFGPQKEIIEDGVSGIFFKPNDVKDLAAKITHLSHKPTTRKKMGEAARQRVKKFDSKKYLEKMLKLIEKYS